MNEIAWRDPQNEQMQARITELEAEATEVEGLAREQALHEISKKINPVKLYSGAEVLAIIDDIRT